MMNNICTLSADIILSRMPVDSVLRCRHVCKTWRALIDDPSRRILITILPADITINILSRLPADSIIQCCKCVCKTWRALIDHPSFVEAHTRRLISSSLAFNLMNKGTTNNYFVNFTTSAAAAAGSSFGLFLCGAYPGARDENKFQLHFVKYNDVSLQSSEPITPHPFPLDYDKWGLIRFSSCNGLVFIGSSKPNVNDVFVCNPFTREYMNLLRNHKADDEDGYMIYGFGYHPRSNVYKVVSIYVGGSDDAPGVVSVYTLGSGSGWRNKGETPYRFFSRRPGLLANGAIHWMNKDDDDNEIIVSFDLADEKFRIVPSPPAPPSPNHVDQLGVLGGCLCVIRSDKTRHDKIRKDIWALNIIHNGLEKEEYSWNRKFSIPWRSMLSHAEPRAISKSGRILLRCLNNIVSYDPKTEGAKCFERRWYLSDNPWIEIVPYMKSFVSPKALGKRSKMLSQKG